MRFIQEDLKSSTFILRGAVMNKKIKSEKYRELSITSLAIGILIILVYSLIPLFLIFRDIFSHIMLNIFFSLGTAIGLSIVAIVCGSIDLKRIKSGCYSNKGRGFDITGIVLGGIWIFPGLYVLVGEIFFPH